MNTIVIPGNTHHPVTLFVKPQNVSRHVTTVDAEAGDQL